MGKNMDIYYARTAQKKQNQIATQTDTLKNNIWTATCTDNHDTKCTF